MVFVFVYMQTSSWELNWTQLNICMWLGVCFIITLSTFIASLTAKVSRQSHRFSHCMHLIRNFTELFNCSFYFTWALHFNEMKPLFLCKTRSFLFRWINAHFLLPMASFVFVCETHFIMYYTLYMVRYTYSFVWFLWSTFWAFLPQK